MFRFVIRPDDKFQHVLSRLQKLVTNTKEHWLPIPIPKYIELETIDQNVRADLRAKLDSVYHEKNITVVVVFKQCENNVGSR